jgi:4-hydroxybenzoate polyprenyltransferase
VLLFLAAYPLLKRFTRLCHYYLGMALALAPVCAWIAIAGKLAMPPLWMALAVTAWTAGFDIIYACQDYAFDVQSGLYSIPRRLGIGGALWFARVLHLGMLACLIALVRSFGLGPVADAGIVAVAGLLAWEHRLVRADDLSRIDAAFFTMNGYVSVIFFVFWATDIFLTRS